LTLVASISFSCLLLRVGMLPLSPLFAYTTLFRSIITDRETGRSRGFGFVELGPGDDATRAIGEFNGLNVKFSDGPGRVITRAKRSEEHTSELQSRVELVCRLLLAKKKKEHITQTQ